MLQYDSMFKAKLGTKSYKVQGTSKALRAAQKRDPKVNHRVYVCAEDQVTTGKLSSSDLPTGPFFSPSAEELDPGILSTAGKS